MIRHYSSLLGCLATFCSAICFLPLAGCNNGPAAAPPSVFQLISQPSFVKAWDVQLPLHPGDTATGVYFLDGTVHVLTSMNYDHAVKGDSGDLLYRNEIGAPGDTLSGGPTLVTDGIVFPTSHTLELFTRDGTFERSIDVKYNITNQAVGAHNFVYVGMDLSHGCLAQVDVTQQIDPVSWTYLTFGTVDGPVAVSDNVVFSGSEDGKVRACLEDRTPFWALLTDSAFDTQSKIVCGIAVDSRSCYCATTSGKFFCLDKNNGKLKWQYFSGQPLESSPQVTDSAIYQYVPGQGLVALDKTRKLTLGDEETTEEEPFHNPKWAVRSAGKVLAEDDQFVYVMLGPPTECRGVAAVDKQSGRVMFHTHRRDLISVAAQDKGGLIYGVTSKGLLVALRPVAQPGSYGEIAANTGTRIENAGTPLDGLPEHVR